jgi:hypothetical protein
MQKTICSEVPFNSVFLQITVLLTSSKINCCDVGKYLYLWNFFNEKLIESAKKFPAVDPNNMRGIESH